MSSPVQDVRWALRGVRRNPWFSLVLIFTLALGIGGNAAIFSVVNNIFYRPLPFPRADRLVRLHLGLPDSSGTPAQVNVLGAFYNDIHDQSKLASLVAMRDDNVALLGGSEPTRASLVHVSSGWMQVFAVRPVLGRYFTEEEEHAGESARVAIISDALWKQWFQGDSSVVGRTVHLEDQSYTVVGVFPPAFRFPYQADIWIPATIPPGELNRDYAVFARLSDGATFAQFREEMAVVSAHMQSQYSGFPKQERITVTPGRESFVTGQDQTAVALLAVVAFLLFIACVDVASLLLARSVSRKAEFALRTALGASYWDHWRLAISETTTFALLGCALGLLLARLLSTYLAALLPLNLREELALGTVHIDLRVTAYALGVSLLVALVCAIAPVLGSRGGNLYEAIKQGSRTTTGGTRRLLESFVVAQIALTLVLLTGAGLMVENFQRLSHRALGVDAAKNLTLVCSLPRTRYLRAEERVSLVRQILASVRAVPGVTVAGIASVNPVYLYSGTWGARVMRKGANSEEGVVVNHRLITPDLLKALGVQVRAGRTFTEQDTTSSEPVAIVSEGLAHRLWPGEDPLGKQIESLRRGGAPQYRTVVGIAADVQDAGDYRETWYVPYAQDPTGPSSDELHLMVRSNEDPASLAHTVATAVWKVDNALPLRNIARLDHLYSNTLVRERTGAITSTFLSSFGLVLATLGAFGVMSFAVYQRTHEIGVRMTLGADSSSVLSMIVSSGLRLAMAGLVIGLMGSFALNRILAGMLPGIGRMEPSIYLLASSVLVLAITSACWLPARRASRVDPIIALRCE